MKNFFSRAARAPRSSSPRRQRGVVGIDTLYSLLLTILVLMQHGFSLDAHPDLATNFHTKCSNIFQKTDPTDIKACADAMLLVTATGFADVNPQLSMYGLILLGVADAGPLALEFNPYTIGFAPTPVSPQPNAQQHIEITVYPRLAGASGQFVNVTVSVTGTNGYAPMNFTGQTDFNGIFKFDIPGAPAGTEFTFTVTADPNLTSAVTETFHTTVSTPPSYSGTFSIQGTEKARVFVDGGTTFSCSCTVTMTGTITATIVPLNNGSGLGLVTSSNGMGTLSNCATTPPNMNADACSHFESAPNNSWTDIGWGYLGSTSSAGTTAILGQLPNVTWQPTLNGGMCYPLTGFSGTITDTAITGTVDMTTDPNNPGYYSSCTVDGVASQFTLQRNN